MPATTCDIYLVRFHPAIGAELKKYRPAVIVSSQVNQLDPRFALIAPLTSHTESQNKFEILIRKGQALSHDSLLLCWYLLTIDSRRLIKRLGHLSPTEITAMTKTASQ